eukprot:7378977-Prymnesium_polylepis.1
MVLVKLETAVEVAHVHRLQRHLHLGRVERLRRLDGVHECHRCAEGRRAVVAHLLASKALLVLVEELGRGHARDRAHLGRGAVPWRGANGVLALPPAGRDGGLVRRRVARRDAHRQRGVVGHLESLDELLSRAEVKAADDHVGARLLHLLNGFERLLEGRALRDLRQDRRRLARQLGRLKPVLRCQVGSVGALRSRERGRRLNEAHFDARLAATGARVAWAESRVGVVGRSVGRRLGAVHAGRGFRNASEWAVVVGRRGREEAECHVVLSEHRGARSAAGHHQEAVGVTLLGGVLGEAARVAAEGEVSVRGARRVCCCVRDLVVGGVVINP